MMLVPSSSRIGLGMAALDKDYTLQQSQRADTMRFSPFRSGRGIFPRGLVQNLRRATYALSQAARPS